MKVRFRDCVAGLTFCYHPCTPHRIIEYDLPNHVAEGYIKRGIAYSVEPEEEPKPKPKRKRAKASKQNKQSDTASE